ncbi:MAG: threonine synthase [Verrucomicrobiota bacterium]
MQWRGIIEHYRSRLPVSEKTPVVSLYEGQTPLMEVPNLAKAIGAEFRIFLKYEALNPTCSFKDRGMTLAISKAKERGAQIAVCASTGNTSAAAAAYAARAGMKCAVILPNKNIAMGKLAQAIMYGAQILAIEGNFDDALNLVRQMGNESSVEIVNSINPVRIEGQKTAAFEICDFLGDAPDFHFLPVGNAGNITAYWRGFREYFKDKVTTRLPKMMGYQAAGAAPIVENRIIADPQTVATAIRIGNPASWEGAKQAVQESSGRVDKVTDEEILDAYRLVAKSEGIFAEPASVAGIAGLIKVHRAGLIPAGSKVTITLTGHGLKDPDAAIKNGGTTPQTVPAEINAIMKAVLA